MEEQVDVVSKHNQVIKTVGKSIAHQEGLLHRIVIGETVNSKGEFCFVRQASDRQDAGQYVSPIGGHVSSGATLEQAIVRECQEECGITPSDFEFVGQTIYNREVISRQENHYFFVYQIMTDEEPVLNHESVEYKWFSIDEIKKTLKEKLDTFGAAWHRVFKNIFPEIYTT